MENNFKDYFAETRKLIFRYLEVRGRLLLLDMVGKASKALGLVLTIILTFLFFFFVILFLGFLFAYWMADVTGSFLCGFALTALLFLVLMIILLIFKKVLIQRPLAGMLVRELVEEINEQQDKIDKKDE